MNQLHIRNILKERVNKEKDEKESDGMRLQIKTQKLEFKN